MWNPALFRERFRKTDYTIVRLAGHGIGFFKIVNESNGLYLADMMIIPGQQGKGVGGKIIDELIDRGRPIRLKVLKSNPARNLYTRKGFMIIEETEHHFQMSRAL